MGPRRLENPCAGRGLRLTFASERFRARVEAAELLARENGEDWSALPLERQDHYFDLAKENQ